MTSYPAITIWQPWASLIAAGAKRFEFRKWAPPRSMWGTRIAIHAGARRIDHHEVQALTLKLRTRSAIETGLVVAPALELLERVLTSPGILPLSSVLCLATLGEPIRDAALGAELGTGWPMDSNADEHSNYGWPLTDIERLEPFAPARGSQGFWTWTQGGTP